MEESESLFITEDEVGQRLDKILAQRFSLLKSRTYFQHLIEDSKVLINGKHPLKRYKPILGDEVEIFFALTPSMELLPENIPLDILFEDNDLIIVNKMAGMVVHPATGNWTGTFINALLYHCQNHSHNFSLDLESQNLRPGIVHRLDKETSGLLIAAKSTLAHQKLIEMFSSRLIHKEYLAICIGNPGNVEINNLIARHPVNRKLMCVVPEGGKSSLSICKTLACDGRLSLVNIILATGRTHQIRVHMKYVNTPVLGDASYGNIQLNSKYGVSRQLLHAHVLRFEHPITGQKIDLKAPIPADMQKYISRIQNL